MPHNTSEALPEDLLTPREHDVLRLVVEALTNKEIAGRLGLADDTINTHIKRILVKLDARNRLDMAVKALQFGLVDLDSLDGPGPRGLYRLTPREEDVLDLVKQGRQTWQIATQLGIDKGTAYNVERNIRRKWNVNSREELLALARTYRRRRSLTRSAR